MAYIQHHRNGGGRQALPRPKSTTKNDLIAAANRAESDSVAPGARQGIPAAGVGANPSAATGPATVPGHQLPRPAEQTHARHRPPRQLDSGDLAIPPQNSRGDAAGHVRDEPSPGVVERHSSATDDDDVRLCVVRTVAWPRLGLNLSAMPGDEVRRQVAEKVKAFYQRTDEPAVVLARAITRRSWSSPLMFGCRRQGAAPDRVHRERHRRVFRGDGRVPTMTCTAAAVQQTVDRTPRGALNRSI
jgi:hypothetical protein